MATEVHGTQVVMNGRGMVGGAGNGEKRGRDPGLYRGLELSVKQYWEVGNCESLHQ